MTIGFALLLLVMSRSSLVMAQYTELWTVCSNTSNNYTTNSPFESNLHKLLYQDLYNDSGDSIFSNKTQGEEPDVVYGLFLCRGDTLGTVCQTCIDIALNQILKECAFKKDAIILYDACMIRYSGSSFFSTGETHPAFCLYNLLNVTELPPDQFSEILSKMFANLTAVATSVPKNQMYAAGDADLGNSTKVYGMVQCTPDLSPLLCNNCLNVILSLVFGHSGGKQGGHVITPSCNLRYELYQFLDPPVVAEAPSNNETDAFQSSRGNKRKIIGISAGVSASIAAAALFGSGVYFQRRRRRRRTAEEETDYSQEVHDFPSFQLELIRNATNHFAEENKLGEGGFGPVYKGTLPNGKEIAIKRLSRNSGQGLQEFKNEISLIARLQHRNLVRLLGCCLEGNELMLIYEYMPNKSLDFFLFDSNKAAQLNWKRRFLIINGIARGLLYLHVDSRLRIIHRDLKVSNILLDHDMNPKIADFGMARIFDGYQSDANTKRIVGTYGYMAPEYAMEGRFSVKSDVFSFGVLLLETISGKRNRGFYLSEHGHSLLTYAWSIWCKGEGILELIDPLLVESCVPTEVLKCIHIGLLCVQEDPADRPTMSTVAATLGSDNVTLRQPTQPAFSVGRLVYLNSC